MFRKLFLAGILLTLALDSGATVSAFLSAGADCSGPASATFQPGITQQVTLCVSSDAEGICGFSAQLQSASGAENDRFRILNRELLAPYTDPNAPFVNYPISISTPYDNTDLGGTVNDPTPVVGTLGLTRFTIEPQASATGASYTVGLSSASIVTIENSNCFGNPTALQIGANFTFNKFVPPSSRLFGISTRMQVLTGGDVMIGGIVIGGSTPKTVVVRARGPSLGVPGALANPTLTIVPAAGGTNLSNDDWQQAPNAAQLLTSGFAPGDPKESAVLATLNPGAYTAIVSGVGNTTGVGIVEVYEIDTPTVPLQAISTRGQVLTGNDVMIGGFIIQGDGPMQVAVRARGPSLVGAGVPNALLNPTLTLIRASDGVAIAVNDDWQQASNAAQVSASGFAPADARESVILINLQPGGYTAIVSGVGNTTGVAIVEVFAAP
jgi:hypothetical protein